MADLEAYRIQGSAQAVNFGGAISPAAGDGVEAELFQIFTRTDIPSLYYKSGPLDTDWTMIGEGSALVSPVYSFVYGVGGPNVGNYYSDFSLLVAASDAIVGEKQIYIDGTLDIPAGSFDLTDTPLIGNETLNDGSLLECHLAFGCVVQNCPSVSALKLYHGGPTDGKFQNNGHFTLKNRATLSSDNVNPVLQASGGNLTIHLETGARIINDTNGTAVTPNGFNINILGGENTTVEQLTIGTAGGGGVSYTYVSTSAEYFPTQHGFNLGTPTVLTVSRFEPDVKTGDDTVAFGSATSVAPPNIHPDIVITLPLSFGNASNTNAAGSEVFIYQISNDNGTVAITPDGADTINGETNPLVLRGVGSYARLTSDGASNWTVAATGVDGRIPLVDAANIQTDALLGSVFSVTLTDNRNLAIPTNLIDGGTYAWIITQDGVGGRTLTFDGAFKWPGGVPPVLSVGPGAVDVITAIYYLNPTQSLLSTFQLNFS